MTTSVPCRGAAYFSPSLIVDYNLDLHFKGYILINLIDWALPTGIMCQELILLTYNIEQKRRYLLFPDHICTLTVPRFSSFTCM